MLDKSTSHAVRVLATLVIACAAGSERASAQDPNVFPFVLAWDDAGTGATNLTRTWGEPKPAGSLGFVTAKDGHLYHGPERLRLLGVNLCFGANFPKPEDARKIAARLAAFGVNAVRLHHMDMFSAPGGIFASGGKTLDPGQLRKLDELVAALKDQGIFIDLNLHVSRTYPDQPTQGAPTFHKGVDFFVPRLIEWQKDYARQLLGHVNATTGRRHADEPAVAIVEINNENGLMSEWWTGSFDAMPAPFRDELARQWDRWLRKTYRDDAALRAAWTAGVEPLGSEMLANGDFARGTASWNLEQHDQAKADAGPIRSGGGWRIQVRQPGREGWHVQFNQSGLALKAGGTYTLTFRARADANRTIQAGLSQAHAPWQAFDMGSFPLTTAWRDYKRTFTVGQGDANARVIFSGLGSQAGGVELADVSLRPGGITGLAVGERLGRIPIFTKAGYGERSATAQRDWIRFLWETEERYWTDMARFIKDEMGYKGVVVGTQNGWSPFPIQAKLDAIDSHAYWQHPIFPGRAWDMDHWYVPNRSMAGVADGGTIPDLAWQRVAGKPFLCTEYNHSAPNTYSTEAFLLASAYAGLQDWDGLFAFAYSHRQDDWDTRKIPSFFDIDQHPGKMVTLIAAAAMFRRGDVAAPLGLEPVVAQPTMDQVVERVRTGGPGVRGDAFGPDRLTALRRPVAMKLGAGDATSSSNADVPGPVTWSQDLVTVDSPRSKAVVGRSDRRRIDLSGVVIEPGQTIQGWSAISVNLLKGESFQAGGTALITATGLVENTNMPWLTPARDSVKSDWGRPPSLVEGITARIALPSTTRATRVWALNERGERTKPVPVDDESGKAVFSIGPAYRTLWYEVEITPRPPGASRSR